ncbi:MAG: class I SAM-dependent methyltransferase [Eubacteriales bacterium]|nr:class I SAM-dependent methyltransferase [Eubacteriales bacterium]
MQEWNRKLLESCSRQWDDAMAHTDNFCAEIRSKAAVDRHAEDSAASYDEGMGKDASRVVTAMEQIRRRGFIGKEMTALDIGSGTGIFTIPFAKEYGQVTSLDISPAMQEIIRKKAASEGLENIDYKSGNWHTLDLDDAGLAGQYDLVLSSLNTRGICSQKTLLKMNQASRQGCCIVSFTGGGQKNHSKELNQLILGRQLTSAGGNDIIMPFNLIYHLGGQPDMAYSKIEWEKSYSADEAVESVCDQFWRFAEITPEIRAKVEAYVNTHLEKDGLYHERARIPVAVMVWDARLVRENTGDKGCV